MKARFPLYICICILHLLLFSCNNRWDDFSTDPDDVLSFSTDTVAFDTIISTIMTPYRSLMVYNRNSKPLRISSVSLQNGVGSAYKINIDGRNSADNTFQDLEIREKDSLYILVSAKPTESGQNLPQDITDHLQFVTNGVLQEVVLSGTTQDVFLWRGRTISRDTILGAEKPYLIFDSLVIDEGVNVSIAAGAVFYMHNLAEWVVKGSLKAHGTLDKPIVIRGDRFDNYVDIPYDHVPGQWGGIYLESGSYDNELTHVRIRNGLYGLLCAPSDTLQSKMKMSNVVMTNFKGFLLYAVNCKIEADNCELSNAKDGLLILTGGSYRFNHCTIVNYYMSNQEAGWGNSDNETVWLLSTYRTSLEDEGVTLPIGRADFFNTVIWGNGAGSDITIGDTMAIRSYFMNCVIPNATATNDSIDDPNAQVVHCLIHEDPKFRKIRSDDLSYDFRLDSLSPARNIANPLYASELPLDLDGKNRFTDTAPDIGAYEYQPENE
ncbi:MAG: hypothetical protein LBR66_08855 [Candidatus Symbiothrix sp.]|nr:hypothetical protein [Candidatus Symbiothrix sp.]